MFPVLECFIQVKLDYVFNDNLFKLRYFHPSNLEPITYGYILHTMFAKHHQNNVHNYVKYGNIRSTHCSVTLSIS